MEGNIKYEYSELIEGKTFNDMGADGWEYVASRPIYYREIGIIDRYIDIFKRKIISE